MAVASAVSSSSRALGSHRDVPAHSFSAEAFSSSWSRPVEARPVSCGGGGGGGEDDVLDLDSPWVAEGEAESRLEAAAAAGLHLRAEEEGDEDEIRDNRQRHEDELMALEAIYGDDLVEFESKEGLHYFQIYIHYDLHDGAEVCAKLSSASGNRKDGCPNDCTEEHDDEPDEFSYTCNFEHLPPLILTCLLPKSYPSKDPPYFNVTAKWMDGHNVSQLCEMLDTIWAELPGQEVVYQWVEWIRNSSLSYLLFDGKITLGSDCPTHKGDNRAISRNLSLESVIPSMLNYSSKKQYEAFLENLHTCRICLNQSKGSNFVRLPCQHLFCVKCMETLCRMHVKEGTVFHLVCPETKCNASIPPYLLKRLLREEEFQRWDRLALEKALDSMSDVVYCPKCAIGCLEDEDNNAQCPKCSFIFCSFCKDPRHPGKQCLTAEQKLQRKQASGRMTEWEMVKEMLSIKKLYRDAILCPKCKMPISRTEGCNKIECGNCGQFLCFRCGKAITGYDHFRSKGCQLFAPVDNDTTVWQRQMEVLKNERGMRAQRRQVAGSDTVKCPKCRQEVLKDDDKYIYCWTCRASYSTQSKQHGQGSSRSRMRGKGAIKDDQGDA
ncbi:hypothetical protein CFC21_018816 [Triticum aestivum]|uniref:RBR-type E3 ubiquitin transferase n=2 Tax=Triticum aestivum TaxID=4565 RepID=A0A3B6B4G5_WHEAT|nr:E3 ubiquitin-protein ligase RNF14-like [Triticum aestivum]KAF7003515.1 hypothetical protein CFC21_018816 [Triticum aestivum]